MSQVSRPRSIKTSGYGGALAVVIGVHAAAIVALGIQTVREFDEGGAPVINLSLVPAARFDSDQLSNPARSNPQAGGASGKAPPRPAPLRLRPAPVLDPLEPTLVPTVEIKPEVRASSPTYDTQAVQNGTPGPRGAATTDGEEGPASPAGTTRGGGARTIGAAAATAEDLYAAQVLAWIERNKRHPGRERGVVTISFELDRQGRTHRLRLVRSSGSRALDRATLDQIAATQPFPRPGAGAEWRLYPFTVNVDYRDARGR